MPSPAAVLAVVSLIGSAQQGSTLFTATTPLELRLETSLRALIRDRGEERAEYPAMLRYRAGTDTGSLPVELRTRGIFRLKRCAFPPLRLDFPRTRAQGTPFAGQDKVKLVTHCTNDERYLLREFALYRVFNALTDTSYRTRLARITYVDTARGRPDTLTRHAFLIEPDAELAARIGTEIVEANNIHDLLTDARYLTLVAVFQYLIGNTDWSVWGRHNIAILRDAQAPTVMLAVPYDFDFSGAVSAPYATPPPQIPIKTVRERWYRGYCQPDTMLASVLAQFRQAKDSIYAAVRAVPDLDARDVRGLLDYFDDFYRAIDNPGIVRREFVGGCRQLPQ